MPAVVRRYAETDLSACRTLWEVLTERHRLIYDDPSIGGDDVGLHFDEHLKHVGPERIWVAEEDGLVVGLTGLIVDEGQAEVEPVVVVEGRRSSGIGAQLIAAAVSEARALGMQHLSIRPVARNSEAIAMFVRQGFGLIGHVELFMELQGRPNLAPRAPARSAEDVAVLVETLKPWS